VTGPYSFDVVELPVGFRELGDAWRGLLGASPADTIFLTPEWMEAWWDAYGAGRRGLLVRVRRGGALLALVPLQIARERWRGVLAVDTLRFLSDGSFDADYLDIVSIPGAGEDLVPEFLAWVRARSRLRHDLARWNELPCASPHAAAFDAALTSSGTLIDRERIGAVVTTFPPTWDAYMASLKPRMRTKIRTLRRELEAAHDVRLLRCEDDQSLTERLPSLFELHQRRWAARGMSGVLGGPRKQAFYGQLSRSLLRQGWLQFHSLEVDGALVAHQFCMGYRGAVYLLQEGYDPAWEKHGVGNILRAMIFERLIAEGWQRYDFLAGVTDHKRSWAGAVTEGVRITARGPSLRGTGIALLERAARAARALRGRGDPGGTP